MVQFRVGSILINDSSDLRLRSVELVSLWYVSILTYAHTQMCTNVVVLMTHVLDCFTYYR